MEIVVATRNRKKKKEIKDILKDLNIKVLSLSSYSNITRVKEGGKSFQENAIKKALTVSRFTKKTVIADDSGLEVDILDGRPGVRSSRFAGSGATDLKNNRKLLRALKGIPLKERKAKFVCNIAIARNGSLIKVVKGSCRGLIGFEPRGRCGFGYDPLFIIPKYKKSFAELGPSIKNKLSHRARALKKARKVILKCLQ